MLDTSLFLLILHTAKMSDQFEVSIKNLLPNVEVLKLVMFIKSATSICLLSQIRWFLDCHKKREQENYGFWSARVPCCITGDLRSWVYWIILFAFYFISFYKHYKFCCFCVLILAMCLGRYTPSTTPLFSEAELKVLKSD